MPRASFRLPFRLLGIPVRIDGSFLLVLPLFAWLIGSQIPAYVRTFRRAGVHLDAAALQGGATPWLLGLTAAVGLFLSVVVHELGHAATARLYGVRVREITLWFLGGVAQFDAMPRQRGAEALVGIAGPITSVGVAALCRLGWGAAGGSSAALFVLSYLTLTNAALAVFNLLPALPLDGGRVLRSLLALAMPHLRATRVAGAIGTVAAALLGIYGFLSLNLFLVVIAFFVYNAGRAETQAAVVSDVFEGRKVRDLMTRDPITVAPDMRLEHFARMVYYRPHTGYPVVDADGLLLGYARLQDARAPGPGEEAGGAAAGETGLEPLEALRDAPTREGDVRSILRPAETIGEDEEAMEALKRIAQGSLGRLAVVDARGRLVGMVSKTDLVRRLQEARGGQGNGA